MAPKLTDWLQQRPRIPTGSGVGGPSAPAGSTKRPRPQETEDDDAVEAPIPKVSPPTPKQVKDELAVMTDDASKIARASELCRLFPTLAAYVLGKYDDKSVQDGWCSRVQAKPTKAGGYLQVSYWGANKFAVLHRVVLWAGGEVLGPGDHASHLCGRTDCKTVGHITPETPAENNSRKGCLGWIDCPCGSRKFPCKRNGVRGVISA